MAEAVPITYVGYPEYKTIGDDFEIMYPFEMPEDIIEEIIKTIGSTELIRVSPNDLVTNIRTTLDNKFGKYWHVFCGKNFGSYSVHDKYKFVFFKYKAMSFMIYKTSY